VKPDQWDEHGPENSPLPETSPPPNKHFELLMASLELALTSLRVAFKLACLLIIFLVALIGALIWRH
jgi:hypothetical protein